MIREALVWLKTRPGLGSGDAAVSWSDRLEGSLNFWSLVEGAHVLSLMLFFGGIVLVDLRLLGVLGSDKPYSRVGRRLLPLTIAGFALLVLTGAVLFFAKPVFYYHNLFFRLKMGLIVLALVNLVAFHRWARCTQTTWDDAPRQPLKARAAGGLSLLLWILVIACGRYIPANWFDCGREQPRLLNLAQSCASSDAGAWDRGSPRPEYRDAGAP